MRRLPLSQSASRALIWQQLLYLHLHWLQRGSSATLLQNLSALHCYSESLALHCYSQRVCQRYNERIWVAVHQLLTAQLLFTTGTAMMSLLSAVCVVTPPC